MILIESGGRGGGGGGLHPQPKAGVHSPVDYHTTYCSLLDELCSEADVSSKVLHEASLLFRIQHVTIKHPRLSKRELIH